MRESGTWGLGQAKCAMSAAERDRDHIAHMALAVGCSCVIVVRRSRLYLSLWGKAEMSVDKNCKLG